ncbi:GYF domain-containing protein [Colwellia sp. RE-S-Sl-9]
MKKWLFSNNGEITNPFTFAEAQAYISENSNLDLYVWHPSFTHWMPLNSIDDFDVEISIPIPPVALPKELIEEYKNQEQGLFKTLVRIDNTLGNTRAALSELDNDIDTYQSFTEKLNTEVEITLKNVRKQYAALQKSIDDFKKDELVF